ncbi:hypothetical protein P0F65_14600 [Sphingomonas sp. I4]
MEQVKERAGMKAIALGLMLVAGGTVAVAQQSLPRRPSPPSFRPMSLPPSPLRRVRTRRGTTSGARRRQSSPFPA